MAGCHAHRALADEPIVEGRGEEYLVERTTMARLRGDAKSLDDLQQLVRGGTDAPWLQAASLASARARGRRGEWDRLV